MSERINIPTSENQNSLRYQEAIDLAWRAEGLDRLLRERGQLELASQVEEATIEAFMLDPNDFETADLLVYFFTSTLDEVGGYDSGRRKFEELPADSEG